MLSCGTQAHARMTAFFFHDPSTPLFGLYGTPCGDSDRAEAVLLCSATGHEYQRTHWCLRLLGDQFMRAGFHVFRFDYSGLGNSWGGFDQGTLSRWVGDVEAAVQELADTSGVRKLSVVGLRLGASLAYTAAREMPVHQLVLWDPILDGRTYVERLRQMQTQQQQSWPQAPPCTPGAPFEDLLGYRYNACLIGQLTQLNLNAADLPRTRRVSLLLSNPDLAAQQLREHLNKHNRATEMRLMKEAAGWDAGSAYGEPVLLPEARKSVLDLLGGSLT
jgi:uncharacterized protein